MIDIPNPPPDAQFLTTLTVHNPVSEEDIANAEVYKARIVKRKFEGDTSVTNSHVAEATRFSNQLNQTLYPMDAAPAWFLEYAATQKVAQAAITVQLTALAGLVEAQAALDTTRHNDLVIGLYNCNAVSYNRFSNRLESDLYPLRDVNGNIPDIFPATRKDLFDMNTKSCRALLLIYALPITGDLDTKLKRLAH